MFLALTRETAVHAQSEAVLRLGSWCRTSPDSAGNELPYHWDDREILYSDWQALRRRYERLLGELCGVLNRAHGVGYPVRSWRFILGAFLSRFLDVVFDRYRSILAAKDSGLVSDCIIDLGCGRNLATTNDFHVLTESESGNLFLYSLLVDFLKPFPFREAHVASPRTNSPDPSQKSRMKQLLRQFACGGNRARSEGRIVFADTYFPRWAQAALELSFAQVPGFFLPEITPHPTPPNFAHREELLLPLSVNDAFDRVVRLLLIKLLPGVYLEGFVDFRRRVLARLPVAPRAVLFGTGHEASETFRFWCAEQVAQGIPVAAVQHGGVYGAGRFSSAEYDERALGNRYYSWGWDDASDARVVPLPAPKLIGRGQRSVDHGLWGGVRKLSAPILWSWNTVPLNSYRLYSVPIAGQIHQFYEFQESFVGGLRPEVKRAMLLRLYPGERGWHEHQRWPTEFHGVPVYRASGSFSTQLREARLFICAYHGTTFLESLAANVPTLIVWDPKLWELRPEAFPFFEMLRAAGIFCPDPLLAAEQLNSVAADPLPWWRSSRVQHARAAFVERFARKSTGWLRTWRRELVSLRNSVLETK